MKKAKQDSPDLATRLVRLESTLSGHIHQLYEVPAGLSPAGTVKWCYDQTQASARERLGPGQPGKTTSATIQERLAKLAGQQKRHAASIRTASVRRFNPASAFEWQHLNDLALVRGFEVTTNSDPNDDASCGKYAVCSVDDENTNKLAEIVHQARKAGDVLEYLSNCPVVREQGYDQRPTVRAAQKRLDDAALTTSLGLIKSKMTIQDRLALLLPDEGSPRRRAPRADDEDADEKPPGKPESDIQKRLAKLKSRPAQDVKVQAYWTLLWDKATSSRRGKVVRAVSVEKALDEAIKQANAESDYGPGEDGGFEAVAAYSRADLLSLLNKVA